MRCLSFRNLRCLRFQFPSQRKNCLQPHPHKDKWSCVSGHRRRRLVSALRTVLTRCLISYSRSSARKFRASPASSKKIWRVGSTNALRHVQALPPPLLNSPHSPSSLLWLRQSSTSWINCCVKECCRFFTFSYVASAPRILGFRFESLDSSPNSHSSCHASTSCSLARQFCAVKDSFTNLRSGAYLGVIFMQRRSYPVVARLSTKPCQNCR